MTQWYTVYRGQPLGEDEVVERLRAPEGDVDIVLSKRVAKELRVGRQMMERWKETLAILAKS